MFKKKVKPWPCDICGYIFSPQEFGKTARFKLAVLDGRKRLIVAHLGCMNSPRIRDLTDDERTQMRDLRESGSR